EQPTPLTPNVGEAGSCRGRSGTRRRTVTSTATCCSGASRTRPASNTLALNRAHFVINHLAVLLFTEIADVEGSGVVADIIESCLRFEIEVILTQSLFFPECFGAGALGGLPTGDSAVLANVILSNREYLVDHVIEMVGDILDAALAGSGLPDP
ncbi:MAG: hypothetical protein ACTHK1_02145, partial [Actinomycetales bacterium]